MQDYVNSAHTLHVNPKEDLEQNPTQIKGNQQRSNTQVAISESSGAVLTLTAEVIFLLCDNVHSDIMAVTGG